jgi:hypothetical protein
MRGIDAVGRTGVAVSTSGREVYRATPLQRATTQRGWLDTGAEYFHVLYINYTKICYNFTWNIDSSTFSGKDSN